MGRDTDYLSRDLRIQTAFGTTGKRLNDLDKKFAAFTPTTHNATIYEDTDHEFQINSLYMQVD